MSEGIKKGDMVRLKSGGPNMMVTYVGEGAYGGADLVVFCEWFDEKNKPQKQDFMLTSVELS